jgi:outer membrane protein assembly complex protein YaeT
LAWLAASALCAAAETRIRINGIQDRSEQQVLDLMGERLYHIKTKPASPSRADDAAFLVRQALQKDGYADVQVAWKIVNSNEILLTVGPSKRLTLGTVSVLGVGNSDATRLTRLFRSPADKDRLYGELSPFREDDVVTGISFIKQDLQAHGYWAAVASIEKRDPDPASGKIHLSIRVAPGPLHHLAAAKISSTQSHAADVVASTVKPYIGQAATTANLNSMRNAVEEALLSRGYPDAKITMRNSLSTPAFIPDFSVELGTRVRLRRITADGLVRTRPARIQQRMHDLESNWYDKAAMNKRLRELLATGAYSSARVETVPVGDHLIDATLHFEESNARETTYALGAGSYQGPIGRFTYTDRNLWGELLGFSTGFEVSGRGILGETSLTNPWLFGTDYALSGRIYALSYSPDGYDSLTSGVDATLSRKFDQHYKITLVAGFSVVDISADGLPADTLGETIYSHPLLRLTQALDYRDNPVVPKTGWHLEMPLQIGSTIGHQSTAYFKSGLIGAWYHPINADYQVAIGGQFGMIIPTGDDADFPIDLRYFNGGGRSVRSFPERELGPTAGTHNYPIGGNAYWTTNAEIIRNIRGPLKLVGFFDAGTLSETFSTLGSAEVELAAGLGLRFDLPIGPIRFEYGYNLTKDPGEPTGTFHFAIGSAF